MTNNGNGGRSLVSDDNKVTQESKVIVDPAAMRTGAQPLNHMDFDRSETSSVGMEPAERPAQQTRHNAVSTPTVASQQPATSQQQQLSASQQQPIPTLVGATSRVWEGDAMLMDERKENTQVTRSKKEPNWFQRNWLQAVLVLVGVLLLAFLGYGFTRILDVERNVATIKANTENVPAHLAEIKTGVGDVKKAVIATDDKGNTAGVADVAQDIRSKMIRKDDLKDLAKSSDLKELAKTSDLKNLAKSSDLSGLAKAKSLREMQVEIDLLKVKEEAAPLPPEENQAANNSTPDPAPQVVAPAQTHNVIIRRVPNYVDVYKPAD